MFSCVPLLKGSLPRAASPRRWSCAGLRLSKNFAPPSPSSVPLVFRGKRVQKYSFSEYVQQLFSIIFQKIYIQLIINQIKITIFAFFPIFTPYFPMQTPFSDAFSASKMTLSTPFHDHFAQKTDGSEMYFSITPY